MNRNQKYRKAQPTQLNWSSQTPLATFSCIIVIFIYHQVLVSRASARLTPYYRLSTMFAAAPDAVSMALDRARVLDITDRPEGILLALSTAGFILSTTQCCQWGCFVGYGLDIRVHIRFSRVGCALRSF